MDRSRFPGFSGRGSASFGRFRGRRVSPHRPAPNSHLLAVEPAFADRPEEIAGQAGLWHHDGFAPEALLNVGQRARLVEVALVYPALEGGRDVTGLAADLTAPLCAYRRSFLVYLSNAVGAFVFATACASALFASRRAGARRSHSLTITLQFRLDYREASCANRIAAA